LHPKNSLIAPPFAKSIVHLTKKYDPAPTCTYTEVVPVP